MSENVTRPEIEFIEQCLKIYQHNRQLTGMDAHHHTAQSQSNIMVRVPDLLAYIRALEAAALHANEQHAAAIDVANGWRDEIEAMREYFGALQGGFYLDGYDAMRQVERDMHSGPTASYTVARGILDWQPGETQEDANRRVARAQADVDAQSEGGDSGTAQLDAGPDGYWADKS